MLYLAPFVVGTEYRLFIATQMAAYVLVAIGLNLLNGYGGQVSLGHGALVAIGAYAVALAMVDHHWSFWPAALLAMVAASAVGAVMALPAFRLSTWYFALITLGFADVVGGLLTEWRELTHGFAGVVGIPSRCCSATTLSSLDLYWLALYAERRWRSPAWPTCCARASAARWWRCATIRWRRRRPACRWCASRCWLSW